MAISKKADTTSLTQLVFQADPGLLSRIEEHAARLATKLPAVRVSRAAAIRELLLSGLDRAERADSVAAKIE